MTGRRPFRTIALTAPGWTAVIVAGTILGFGLAQLADLSPLTAPFVGCALLLLALVLFDRRRSRKQLATVLLALDRPTVDGIVADALASGVKVTAGLPPEDHTVVPTGQTPLRCRRSDVERLLAIVERHSPPTG